jgi:hypothetical protein
MPSTPLSKAELLSQLTNAKNNYILGMAAISLFSSPATLPILEQSHAAFGPYSIQFGQVAGLLRISKDREIAIKEFLTSQIRSLIKESFELLKNYTEETKQEAALQAEPWYQFARMIRNCLSHNFRFGFNAYDKKKLPQTWKAKTIAVSMDDQPLELAFFGYTETWEMFREFEEFAKQRLV